MIIGHPKTTGVTAILSVGFSINAACNAFTSIINYTALSFVIKTNEIIVIKALLVK